MVASIMKMAVMPVAEVMRQDIARGLGKVRSKAK